MVGGQSTGRLCSSHDGRPRHLAVIAAQVVGEPVGSYLFFLCPRILNVWLYTVASFMVMATR